MMLTYYGPGHLVTDAPEARRPKGIKLHEWTDLELFLRHHETVGAKEAGGYIVLALVLPGPRCDANCKGEEILGVDYEPHGAAQWGADAWPCSYTAHTTASHRRVTKKNPDGGERWRAFLRMAEQLPENKKERDAAVARIEKLCPPGSVIRSVSQPAYLPTRPTEDDPPVEYRSDDTRGALDWRELVESDAPADAADVPTDTDDENTDRKIDPESEPDVERLVELAEGVVALWPPGNRHFSSMALAGVLYRSAWRSEVCEGFAETVLALSGSNTEDGMQCFADTFDAAERGDPVKGVPKFRELLAYGCEFPGKDERDRHFAGLADDVQLTVSWRWFMAGLLASLIRHRKGDDPVRLPVPGPPLVWATPEPEPEPAPKPGPEPAPKASKPPRVNPLTVGVIGWGQIQQPLPPVNWVCRDLDLAAGRPNMWFGTSGTGKTTQVMSLGVAVAAGRPAFGAFPVRQGKVRHIDLDAGRAATIAKYQRLAIGMGTLLEELPIEIWSGSFKLDDAQARKDLAEVCEGHALCIIDSLRRIATGDEKEMGFAEPMIQLRAISEATGCAFVLIHHSVKAAEKRGLLAASGTGDIGANAGCAILVERNEDGVRLTREKVSEHDEVDDFTPIDVVLTRSSDFDPTLGRAGMVATAVRETKKDKVTKEEQHIRLTIRSNLEAQPGMSVKDITKACGKKEKDVKAVLDSMTSPGAGEGRLYRYKCGADGKRLGYFLASREDVVEAALNVPRTEGELPGLTELHRGEVREALSTLLNRRRVQPGIVAGDDGWIRVP